MLKLNQIHYAYGQTASLVDINLTIDAGEFVAFMGPNGSGKSTLFKLINGLIEPTSGYFEFKTQRVDHAFLKSAMLTTQLHQSIGFVFQNSDVQLFNETVLAELAFGPQQMGLSNTEVQQRVYDCLQLLHIEHLADRVPYQLSGGEKKLVAIACVLTMNPEVVVLDEPFNGLSTAYQTLISQVLLALHQAGKTILIASHQFEQVKQIAQRIVVFNEHHQIDFDLPLQTILKSPAKVTQLQTL